MTVVVFSMSGEVRGKGRPRATVRQGFARIYTDEKTREYEASITECAARLMAGRPPFAGPIGLTLRLRLAPPKSMSKKMRARVLAGEVPYFGSIDADNAAKSVADSLNGVVFADDKQVTRLFVTKVASETPGIDVRVEAFDG